MPRGTHGEKIIAALESTKLPSSDKPRLEVALQKYDEWVSALDSVDAPTVDELIEKMIDLLNSYKFYIDVDLIFDSPEDFLYRQKGQLKLDNTVIEEFLPIFVRKCIIKEFGVCDVDIGSQTATFSSAYFASSLSSPSIGGGLSIKTKDQDFSMSRKLYLRSSYRQQWLTESISMPIENIGYCVEALLYLSNEEMVEHDQYIRASLLGIYSTEYEKASSIIASNIRKAICRIDEGLYLED